MEKETWKDIPLFEEVYQISNYGRLKSFKNHPAGKILSNKNKNGWYFTVNLSYQDIRITTRIHLLVAKMFVSEKPLKNAEVHHIDGNKQNNYYENIIWIDPKSHHKITHLENPNCIKALIKYNQEIRPNPIIQLTLDGVFLNEFINSKIAAEVTGVCRRNILQVASKEEYKQGKVRKQAGGYIWMFKSTKL
jgi:hypothetical protein